MLFLDINIVFITIHKDKHLLAGTYISYKLIPVALQVWIHDGTQWKIVYEWKVA